MAVTAPVWKDTNYIVNSGVSPYTYSIKLKTGRQIIVNEVPQDEILTVYSGKAWVRPGDSTLEMNVNKVAQNYLSSDLPDLRSITATTQYVNAEACRQFYFANSAGTTVETYNFLLNYSYKDLDLTTNQNLSEPVNGHGTPGMLFLSTIFSASSQNVVTTLSISGSSGYDETHCGDFALYYLNVHGGWDSYLIEGNGMKTDNYTLHQMSKSYSNSSIDFGKRTYNNEITSSFQLYTGWLKDDEAERLVRNLLSSTKVYLHDLVKNEFYPVWIKDTLATYKTFKNQGHKRVNYQINVETSQSKVIIS